MNILIKNMEMPKNCAECDFSKRRHSSMGDIIDCKRIGTVGSAFNDPHMIFINRHPNCPLVKIPPHGRLIDADEIIRIWDGATFEGSIKPLIDARPAVIEAEGSE